MCLKDLSLRKKYNHRYYLKNILTFKEYSRKQRILNKDKIRIYMKKYSKSYLIKNKDRLKKKAQEYYIKNKKIINKKGKQYRQKNKVEISMKNKKDRNRFLRTWEGYIPKKTICPICRKEIFFNKRNKANAIHFDHKDNKKILIKEGPTTWLMSHVRNSINRKIWESCNFGMLCGRCNGFLPTKDRKKFVKRIIKYVFGNLLLKGDSNV